VIKKKKNNNSVSMKSLKSNKNNALINQINIPNKFIINKNKSSDKEKIIKNLELNLISIN